MASERLISAMRKVNPSKSYKYRSVAGSIPSTPEIELKPLERIEADLSQPAPTTQLAEMELKKVNQTNLPQFHVDATTPVVEPKSIYPQPTGEAVQVPLRPLANLDWNDINDRRLLLDAQLRAESGYNPNVTSPAGAQGIAQFMPSTWADYQKKGWVPKDKTPYDVDAALQGQRKYMERMFGKDLVQKADSATQTKMALASYNAGYGRVLDAYKKAEKSGNPQEWTQYLPNETINYIDKILDTARLNKEKQYIPEYSWGYKKQGGNLNTTKS